MLRKLYIENLAVIEKVEFDLDDGFCVFTGETGAGKSLIVGAIEMLLGGKADITKIRTGADEAIIEGHFQNSDEMIKIRRKVLSTGRSYAWFNDEPISLRDLASRTEKIADLLGQHEHQVLLNPTSHIDYLDKFAGLENRARDYKEGFNRLEEINSKLNFLDRQIERAEEQAKLREFELAELRSARLDLNEWNDLSTSLKKLEESEKILDRANRIREAFSEGEPNVQNLLGIVEKSVADMRGIVPECAQFDELLETAHAVVAEISHIADEIISSMDIDPDQVEELRTRQAFLQRLCKKYGKDIRGLIEYKGDLEKKFSGVDELKMERNKLEAEANALRDELVKMASELSQLRRKYAPELSKTLIRSLIPLGMRNVRFEVLFSMQASENGPIYFEGKGYALLPTGAESAEFLISPNPGEELKPLASIVSGGELSRIMLALKTIISNNISDSTLIFDEVDTGIGGDVGHAVGRTLEKLSKNQQVIVVTHLPQIAQKANAHYAIEKFEEKGRTKVRVVKVIGKNREKELSRMHGDEKNVIVKNGGQFK